MSNLMKNFTSPRLNKIINAKRLALIILFIQGLVKLIIISHVSTALEQWRLVLHTTGMQVRFHNSKTEITPVIAVCNVQLGLES